MIPTGVGDLEVRVVGDVGPPTALLWHSLFVDSETWVRVERSLAEGRRLVLVTGPGHGASSDPEHRYTIDDCAEAVRSILDHLGIEEPVDLVGNAWGGHVGIVFAARYPGRCRSLVTVGTPVHGYSTSGRIQTSLLLLMYRIFGPRRFLVNAVVEALLSERTRADDPEAVAITRDGFTRAGGLVNAVISISLRRPDLTSMLPDVKAPSLFVTGSDHPDWTPDQARAASRLLPEGSVAVLEDSAYLGPLERPDEFAGLVREFWAS